jgi:hypothetical protein
MTQLPYTTLVSCLNTCGDEDNTCSSMRDMAYTFISSGNFEISKPKDRKNDDPQFRSTKESLFPNCGHYEESPLRWVLFLGLVSLNIMSGFSWVMYISIPEYAATYFGVDEGTLL